MVRPENFQVHFAQEALRKRQTFKSSSFGPESKNAGRFRRYTLSGRRTRLELIILKGMNLKPESSDLRENQTLYWGPSSKRVGALGRQGGVPKIRETFVTSACSKDTRAHTHTRHQRVRGHSLPCVCRRFQRNSGTRNESVPIVPCPSRFCSSLLGGHRQIFTRLSILSVTDWIESR